MYEIKKDDIKPADEGVINAETTATINNHPIFVICVPQKIISLMKMLRLKNKENVK